MRLRPRHALFLLIASALCSIIYLTHPYYETWHGFAAISASRRLLSNRPGTHKHPLLILQHLPRGSLASASRASHAMYARAWGYRYMGDAGRYVEDGPRGCLNKEWAMKKVLERELVSARPAEWIVYSDADAIVTDPSVPLHSLLPPSTLSPAPHLLFGQDHNGLNAGVCALRVSPLALAFVDRILALAETNPDPLITDQHWVGVALRSNASFAEAFAEMPRTWMNAYFLDEAGPSSGAEGGEDEEKWQPQWQVHLVNHLKRKYSFRPLVERALAVYEQAVGSEEAGGQGERRGDGSDVEVEGQDDTSDGQRDRQDATENGASEDPSDDTTKERKQQTHPNGLDTLPQAEWTRLRADEWWAKGKTGIEDVRFLDEERMKIVDREGTVLN